MKLIRKGLLFIFILTSINLFAQSQEKKYNFSIKDQALSEVMKQVEQASGYTFFYDAGTIDLTQKVCLEVKDYKINDVVKELLKGTGLNHEITNTQIALIPTTLSAARSQGNELYSGVVLDDTGEPIIGAGVFVEGTGIGTVTNMDGEYSFSAPAGSVVTVHFLGFLPQKITKGGESTIILKEDLHTLDEVVVVAFGTQKRANLTAAVATVNSKELEGRPVQNLSQALQGVSPGLNITANTRGGDINSTPTINIRGSGSIGQGSSSSPLILIDGIEGDMNLINPQDVENLSVLKDAGAAAIYGSRAAFGVILITTKRGSKGAARVNYNNSFRWSKPTNLPSFVDGYSFATYFNEASANGGLGNVYSESMLENTRLFMEGKMDYATEYDANGVWKCNMESWGNTEWFGVYYKDWSFSQEHNVSLTGGTDVVTYYISGNLQDIGTDQNYGNEDYKRYTLNSNVNIKAYKWLDINLNTKFIRKDYDAPYYQRNSVYYHSMPRRKPSNVIKTPDGIYAKESQLNEIENGGNYTENVDRLYQQLQFVFKPVKNLEIFAEGNFRLDRKDTHAEVLLSMERKEDGSSFAMARDDGYGGRSFVQERMYKENFLNPNIYGKYNLTFNDSHNFTLTTGFQAEKFTYKDIGAQRDDLISQNVPTLNNTTSSKTFTIYNTQYEWATAGFFARLNYDYKSRYLFEVNYRYDGTSRFIGDKRWNHFPSFSGAWNIAREGFMDDYQKLIGNLKLRASYGSLGNQSASSDAPKYPFYTSIPIGTANGGWLVNGVRPNSASPETVVNPLLGWERVESTDVGIDLGLFNNRLNVNFDYFRRTTKDMIARGEELPNTIGYNYNSDNGISNAADINNAKMRTRGWEIMLTWRDALENGLNYGVALSLSDALTEVLEYPNPTNSITQNSTTGVSSSYYKGMKLGEIWGYETNGLARTDEEMQNHLNGMNNGGQSTIGNVGWKAGDVMYKDINGDGKIDGGLGVLGDMGDRVIIGNTTPRYNFGINLNASFRNFDASAFFQGTLKRDYWVHGLYFWGATNGYWQSTALNETMDYFRAAGTDSYFGPNVNGYLPRPLYNSFQNQQVSSQYLQNVSYIRLKNLQIGYTLPYHIVQRAKVSNLRIFFSADNVFTLTKMKADAFDPEVLDGHAAGQGKASPLRTTLSCGLSITL